MHILSTSATTLMLAGYMLAAGHLFSRKCWLAIAIVWFPTMGSMAWLAWTYSYQFMYPSPDIYQPNYRPVIFPDAVLEVSFLLFWLTLPLGVLAGALANSVGYPEPASTQSAAGVISCRRE
jgi:hypothetical protein